MYLTLKTRLLDTDETISEDLCRILLHKFIADYFPSKNLLQWTLTCFYNQSCINELMVEEWITRSLHATIIGLLESLATILRFVVPKVIGKIRSFFFNGASTRIQDQECVTQSSASIWY
ncbi:unnamed protein product [Adineta steineri]|uniref:Uncharacterized protein n=1 Tax=Adineta steineri TaxID=433720 RepID=A0A813UM76_9BILA|nr:unnamed protein product [Adineta steineri]